MCPQQVSSDASICFRRLVGSVLAGMGAGRLSEAAGIGRACARAGHPRAGFCLAAVVAGLRAGPAIPCFVCLGEVQFPRQNFVPAQLSGGFASSRWSVVACALEARARCVCALLP